MVIMVIGSEFINVEIEIVKWEVVRGEVGEGNGDVFDFEWFLWYVRIVGIFEGFWV